MPTDDHSLLDPTALFRIDADPFVISISLHFFTLFSHNHSLHILAILGPSQFYFTLWVINKNLIHYYLTHITVTLRNYSCATVQIGSVYVPHKNEVKYLGMHHGQSASKQNENSSTKKRNKYTG
jgi:predicted membrane protein